MIFIQSKTDGFRRCGEAHSTAGRQFSDERFTDEELAEMEADPELMVRHIPDPPAQDPDEEALARQTLEKMTNTKLKSECDAMGIEYPANAVKSDLVDLILFFRKSGE
jgi:hypothetical protein